MEAHSGDLDRTYRLEELILSMKALPPVKIAAVLQCGVVPVLATLKRNSSSFLKDKLTEMRRKSMKLRCKATNLLPVTPVLASDGFFYEESALDDLVKAQFTKLQKLQSMELVNRNRQKAIKKYCEKSLKLLDRCVHDDDIRDESLVLTADFLCVLDLEQILQITMRIIPVLSDVQQFKLFKSLRKVKNEVLKELLLRIDVPANNQTALIAIDLLGKKSCTTEYINSLWRKWRVWFSNETLELLSLLLGKLYSKANQMESAEAWLGYIDASNLETKPLLSEYYRACGDFAFAQQAFASAIKDYEASIASSQNSKAYSLGALYDNLATSCYSVKEYTKSGRYLKMSVNFQFKVKEYELVLTLYNRLESLYDITGEAFQKQCVHLHKLRVIYTHISPNEQLYASTCYELGLLYISQYPEDALKNFSRCLRVKQKLDPKDFELWKIYMKCGDTNMTLDRYDTALESYRSCISILEEAKRNHTEVAVAYCRLGDIYCKKQDLVQAETSYRRGAELLKNYNSNHEEAANAHKILAKLCQNSGRVQQAQSHSNWCRDIEEYRLRHHEVSSR
jgi:tetratricopeptide (TPR) repeat protein